MSVETISYAGQTIVDKIKIAIDSNTVRIKEEKNRAMDAELLLWERAEANKCVNIVDSYALLLELDTEHLAGGDKVIVRVDEQHEDSTYVWMLSKDAEMVPTWVAVGKLGGSDSGNTRECTIEEMDSWIDEVEENG